MQRVDHGEWPVNGPVGRQGEARATQRQLRIYLPGALPWGTTERVAGGCPFGVAGNRGKAHPSPGNRQLQSRVLLPRKRALAPLKKRH